MVCTWILIKNMSLGIRLVQLLTKPLFFLSYVLVKPVIPTLHLFPLHVLLSVMELEILYLCGDCNINRCSHGNDVIITLQQRNLIWNRYIPLVGGLQIMHICNLRWVRFRFWTHRRRWGLAWLGKGGYSGAAIRKLIPLNRIKRNLLSSDLFWDWWNW